LFFQTLAGLCAALLTFWRPFMRTESSRHVWGHSIVGLLGIIFVVIAGYLNSSSQGELTTKLNDLQQGIATIGDKIGASGDAASVLAKTAQTLDRLNSRVITLDERLEYSEVSMLNPLGLKGIAEPPLVEKPTELSQLLSPYVHFTAQGIMSWDCTSAALAAFDAAIKLSRKFPFAYYFKGGCGKLHYTPDWEGDIEVARRILLITTTIPGQNPSQVGVLKMIQSGDYGR
jgi:hypothetical protein